MSALRNEFGEIVHGLVDKLTGDGRSKVLKSAMFNKMMEFLG